MHCTVYLIFMTLSWSLECAMHKLRNLMALLSIRISFVYFFTLLITCFDRAFSSSNHEQDVYNTAYVIATQRLF